MAEKTGIKELRRTTPDEPDYDKLMRGRLEILDRHGLKLTDIQQVIGTYCWTVHASPTSPSRIAAASSA